MAEYLKKSFKKFKILRILNSRFRKETDELTERLDICKNCPHNSLNANTGSFKLKTYKALSDVFSFLTRAKIKNEDLKWSEEAQCTKCGCTLYYKAIEPQENCPIKKWK